MFFFSLSPPPSVVEASEIWSSFSLEGVNLRPDHWYWLPQAPAHWFSGFIVGQLPGWGPRPLCPRAGAHLLNTPATDRRTRTSTRGEHYACVCSYTHTCCTSWRYETSQHVVRKMILQLQYPNYFFWQKGVTDTYILVKLYIYIYIYTVSSCTRLAIPSCWSLGMTSGCQQRVKLVCSRRLRHCCHHHADDESAWGQQSRMVPSLESNVTSGRTRRRATACMFNYRHACWGPPRGQWRATAAQLLRRGRNLEHLLWSTSETFLFLRA